MILHTSYRLDCGEWVVVEGESLEEIATTLKHEGYAGPPLRVYDLPGFSKGWVQAGEWSETGLTPRTPADLWREGKKQA
jgi:hypothetical protein